MITQLDINMDFRLLHFALLQWLYIKFFCIVLTCICVVFTCICIVLTCICVVLTCNFLNNLRRQFKALVESYDRACDQDLLQQSYNQTICALEYRGRVGRPSMHVTPDQLHVLYNEAGFCWADVSRILGISERTIR